MSSYVITIGTLIAIQAIAVCGLNVIVGYAGQISLGHAAFFGIGAYTAALFATKAGLSFWASLPIVIAISALIGLLLGLPSIRVREDFLAITTIGINFIVEAIFRYVPFFGGALGIGGIPKIAFYGVRLKGISFFILCLVFLFLVIGLCYWLKKSWASLACYAIREEEQAASTLGISPVKFKLLAFVIGTAIAGIGGSLYAHYMQFISAGDFSFPISVGFLSMLVLGGMGTLWGPVLGTLILGILPEIFRPLVDYRILLYTILLLIMIRFQPGGLLGEGSAMRRIFEPLLRVKR
ncbi:MAG TPA: branched-chain amino acid ABC transporter permease [Syntrophorhabdaceae bacterium]|nr:branched-chain amino acid ABC transporter permease [Syntrophorhabdaceae bacterium]HPU28947.1 branched-chain amino acid ABC transporter permease [Syntrophorhabdaceae bacterium]